MHIRLKPGREDIRLVAEEDDSLNIASASASGETNGEFVVET